MFLAIIDPSTQDFTKALIYSTYFGGSDGEVAYDMRRDTAGKYYLCGYTLSLDFPMLNALSPASYPGDSMDGFVAVIDPGAAPLKALVYSSYLRDRDISLPMASMSMRRAISTSPARFWAMSSRARAIRSRRPTAT